jgi:hypothetical protein
MESKDFVSMAFSSDAKFLVTQTKGPEWLLQFWSWEKAKVLASIRTTNPPEKTLAVAPGVAPTRDQQKDLGLGTVVYQWYLLIVLLISLMNPSDNTQISVVGNGIFRIYRYTEGALKVTVSPKIDQRVKHMKA